MTMVQRSNPIFHEAPSTTTSRPVYRHTSTRAYQNIMVFLNGSASDDQAIIKAIRLARANVAEVTLVSENHVGVEAYLNNLCANLYLQGVKIGEYLVVDSIADHALALAKTEQADALVMARPRVNRMQRLLGGDLIRALRTQTDADVYTVTA